MRKFSFLMLGMVLLLTACQEPFQHNKYETEYPEDTKINISQIIGPNGPIGYVHEWAVVENGLTREVYRVYDINEQERGFMLETGATYQYDRTGVAAYLNHYDLETAVRYILNVRDKIRLKRPTDRPWKPKKVIKKKKKKIEEDEE